jgi:hypothetical protein
MVGVWMMEENSAAFSGFVCSNFSSSLYLAGFE